MMSKVDHKSIEIFLGRHRHIEVPHLYSPGKTIGDWQIQAFIGRGASGEVYRAVNAKLGTIAAVKVLTRKDETARMRFRQESAILSECGGGSFPRFYGYGEWDGYEYLALELLEPLSLPRKEREVRAYIRSVAAAVAELHARSFVHRDLKPANIMQRGDSGVPVLIDLGLVKNFESEVMRGGNALSIVDGQAFGVGTPGYSAPEQFEGGDVSPAADIHALGILANECFRNDPPRRWRNIIRRSTSTIPRQRYSSVKEFVKAVEGRGVKTAMKAAAAGLAVLVAGAWIAFSSVDNQVRTVAVDTGSSAESASTRNLNEELSLTLAQQSNVVVQVLNAITRELEARNSATRPNEARAEQISKELIQKGKLR